jgi:hypothetical protein
MLRTSIVATCVLLWLPLAAFVGQAQPEQEPSAEVPSVRWNDASLIAGEGAPAAAYADRLRIPTEEDALRIVPDPREAVKQSCLGFIRSALAPDYVPEGLAEHLIAVEASPTFEGKDVFVVWYATKGLLIHIVETSLDLTVRVVDLEQQQPVPEEERAPWLLALTAQVLGPGVAPHPLDSPPGELKGPWGLEGQGRFDWWTAAAPLDYEPDGRPIIHMEQLSAPILPHCRANSDGRYTWFMFGKLPPSGQFPEWTGRFRPPPPPLTPPPPPPWQPNLEPIEFKTELTAEEQANQVN